LRNPYRMVDIKRQQHDPVTQADALGLGRQEGEYLLGRGAVGKSLQEMMFGEPYRAIAQRIGELDLLDAFPVDSPNRLRTRIRSFQFIKNAQFQVQSPLHLELAAAPI